MKSKIDAGIAPDDGGEQVGRNTQVGRDTPSSDSEIRCVSREVAQGSQSWRLPTHCYTRHWPDCIALPVLAFTDSLLYTPLAGLYRPTSPGVYRLIAIYAIGRTVSPYQSWRLPTHYHARYWPDCIALPVLALTDSLPRALLAGLYSSTGHE
jgi:hypothetical protein